MKRALVIGHAEDAGAISLALQRAGVIQVEASEYGDSPDADRDSAAALQAECRSLADQIDDARFVSDFLRRYRVPPKRPFASFVTEKLHTDVAEFESAARTLNFEHLLSVCREYDAALAGIQRDEAVLDRREASLGPWAWLDVELSKFTGTAHTVTMWLRGDPSAIAALETAITERALAADIAASGDAAAALAYADDAETLRDVARGIGLIEVAHPGGTDRASMELEAMAVQRTELTSQIAELEGAIARLTLLYPGVIALLELSKNGLARIEARRRFGATQRAFFVQGWVREDRVAILGEAMAPFRDVDVTLVDPLPDETRPVEIANPKWLEPFELLTRLYGMPDHNELDPTPLFAPFFTLFFGMTIGDVGYGLMLVVACWLMLKHLDIAENAKKFMRLVIYGGLAAMVFGVLTGGWFGVDIKDLPPVLKGLVVLDPLANAMAFLILSTVLGVIQISWGITIEAIDNVRNGAWFAALAEQATALLVLLSGVVAFAGWIASTAGSPLPSALAIAYPLSLKGLILGAAGVVLLTGDFFGPLIDAWRDGQGTWGWVDRGVGTALAATVSAWVLGGVTGAVHVGIGVLLAVLATAILASRVGRKMTVGALSGTYNLYGMSAYIGDVLSYARLMALGLATVLIGSTVNMMARLVFASLPGWPAEVSAGALLSYALTFLLVCIGGLAILLVGHTFNVVINLLGSFVHPMRLQFVEFFSKFYEGSGRPFRPLAYTTDVLVLDRPER